MTNIPPTPTEIYTAIGALLANNPETKQYMTVDVKDAVNTVVQTAIDNLGWSDLEAAIECLPMAFMMGVEVGRDIERARAFAAQFGADE